MNNKGSFIKGMIPWNKGLKRPEMTGNNNPAKKLETKLKISLALRGKKKSLEHRRKLSEVHRGKKLSEEAKNKLRALSGDKSSSWRGGITPKNNAERREFRRTVGKEVLKRDNYTCQLCGSKRDLQVDHIQSWSEYVELRFSMDNCRTICAKCHYQITFGKPMPENIKTWGHNFGRRKLK